MKNSSVFRTKEQELERLVREIEDVKSSIREIEATVTRIERHVRRAFDAPLRPKDKVPNKKLVEKTAASDGMPTISADEARAIFNDLSLLFNDGQRAIAHERLQSMSIPDLRFLARELGVTFRSRPSRKSLCTGIMGRLNERAMLSKNVNLTRPRAASDTGM